MKRKRKHRHKWRKIYRMDQESKFQTCGLWVKQRNEVGIDHFVPLQAVACDGCGMIKLLQAKGKS